MGSLTLKQLIDRQAFLYGGTGANKSDVSSGLARAAQEMMGRTGRKEIPLGDVIGVM